MDESGSRYEKSSSERDALSAVETRTPFSSPRTSPTRMRLEPYDPTAAQTSVCFFARADGGSSTSVPPSDPRPSAAGANDRNTRTCAPGQSGNVARSSVGSAPPVSGTPARKTATCVELVPRMESVAKESSAPSRRTWTPGNGSMRLAVSVISRGASSSFARDTKPPACGVPRTRTSSPSSACAEEARKKTGRKP